MGGITLSVIIPVFNTARYLPDCLESILAANLEAAEVILVDDGSTDGSAEICREYAGKFDFIRVVRQENAGPSAARNRGLALACGEYVAFWDSDDYIAPAAFRGTASLLRLYPDAEMWVSDFCRVADNGCVLDRVCQIRDAPAPAAGRDLLRGFLARRDCVWNVWRYIFRRDFLLRGSLRFLEGVDCAEDLEFMVRALTLAERPVFFHNPYYSYRVNYGNTLTRRYTAKRVEQLMEMLQRCAGYLKDDRSDTAQLLLNKLTQEYLLNLALLREIPAEERGQAARSMGEAAWITSLASRRLLKLIVRAVSLLGINMSSRAACRMKRVKRRLRGIKSALYGSRAGGGGL